MDEEIIDEHNRITVGKHQMSNYTVSVNEIVTLKAEHIPFA